MCVAPHNLDCTPSKDSTALDVDGGILWASMDWEYNSCPREIFHSMRPSENP